MFFLSLPLYLYSQDLSGENQVNAVNAVKRYAATCKSCLTHRGKTEGMMEYTGIKEGRTVVVKAGIQESRLVMKVTTILRLDATSCTRQDLNTPECELDCTWESVQDLLTRFGHIDFSVHEGTKVA